MTDDTKVDAFDNIPAFLRRQPHWHAIKSRRGKNYAINADGHRIDDPASPRTWYTFDEALAIARNRGGRLAFVPDGTADTVFIRAYGCFGSDHVISAWAEDIRDVVNSYSEALPDNNGLLIVARGVRPFSARLRVDAAMIDAFGLDEPAVEVTSGARLIEMTGHRCVHFPADVEYRPEQLSWLRECTATGKIDLATAPGGADSVPALMTKTAAEMDAAELPDVDFVVPDLITVGATLLAGKPKSGKSWLVLDLALAVACGGHALGGIKCDQGDALVLALEDNERRYQRRMRQLMGDAKKPARLSVAFEARRTDDGLPDQVRRWAGSVERPRLVVVDTLQVVRPVKVSRSATQYAVDYEVVAALNKLAHELGIAIIIVHHVRKTSADDLFDTISGTLGLNAAADTIAVLGRDSGSAVLAARGRDIEGAEWAMSFAGGRWTRVGDAAAVRMTEERQEIVAVLQRFDRWTRAEEVATEIGKGVDAVRRALDRMVVAGEGVERQPGRGTYRATRAEDRQAEFGGMADAAGAATDASPF